MNKFGKKVLGKLGVTAGLLAVLAIVSCGKDDAPSVDPPVASFTTSVDGLDVTVTNTSTGATSYSWDFGDNSALVTIDQGTYTYAAAGTYTITLTATNDGGSDSATAEVTLVEPCDDDATQSLTPNLAFTWGDASAQFDGAIFDGFGAYATERVSNPDLDGNSSCFVGQITRGAACETWAGVGGGLDGRVDFSTHGTTISLDVWSPASVGATVRLVFEKNGYPDTQPAVGVSATTTKSEEWETLTFDFSGDAASGNDYGNLILYTDPPASQGSCAGEVWYVDNLIQN